MTNPSYDFSGAHVLVTGGTSGIGAAAAEAYREAGANVTITGTRGSASEYDADLSGYRYLQMDIENGESIDAVAASLDRRGLCRLLRGGLGGRCRSLLRRRGGRSGHQYGHDQGTPRQGAAFHDGTASR